MKPYHSNLSSREGFSKFLGGKPLIWFHATWTCLLRYTKQWQQVPLSYLARIYWELAIGMPVSRFTEKNQRHKWPQKSWWGCQSDPLTSYCTPLNLSEIDSISSFSFLKNGARNLASNEPNQFRYWTVLYQSAASFHGVARNPNGPPKFFQFSPSRHLNWIFNHGPLHFQEPIRHNFVVIFSRTCYSLPSSFSLSPKSKWFL